MNLLVEEFKPDADTLRVTTSAGLTGTSVSTTSTFGRGTSSSTDGTADFGALVICGLVVRIFGEVRGGELDGVVEAAAA